MHYMSLSRGSNIDALILSAAHVLIDDTADYMRSIDTSNTVISKKFDKRIYKRIKQYSREKQWNQVPTTLRKIVAAVMVFCTISFAMCMSVEAVRENVWDTILKWYDKFVAVFYVIVETPPNVIEEYREPALQLRDTEKIIIVQADTLNQIFYMKDSDLVLAYQQMIITNKPSNVDNENCDIKDVEINRSEGQLFAYTDGSKTITWNDDSYLYILTTYSVDIDSAILISIAESVK